MPVLPDSLRRCTPLLLAGGALLWAGCEASSSPTPEERLAPAPRPDVVLLTVDTLRQDRVSAYGYPKNTTPFLDALARDGVRFTRAYSTSSWTVPALVSMLTSLDPTSHGIQHGFVTESRELVRQEMLLPEHRTLAEILRDHGYRTFGVTANGHLRRSHGFDQGFDRYRCLGFASAETLARKVDEWTAEIRAAEPYFLWAHYFDPHGPYEPRQPHLDELSAQDPPLNAGVVARIAALARRSDYDTVDLRDPDVRRAMGALYDGEVHYTDGAIETLFRTLGIGDDALVIVTSDHGEEFLDHDDIWHGHSLYEELVLVPLIVRLPGGRHAGRVVDEPVSLLDIAPTIAAYLDIETPDRFQGLDLLGFLQDGPARSRPIHATLTKVRTLEALYSGGYKYIRDLDHSENSQLFDLRRDPREQHNLIGDDVRRAQSMALELRSLIERRREFRLDTESLALSVEEVEELRSLGYIQ